MQGLNPGPVCHTLPASHGSVLPSPVASPVGFFLRGSTGEATGEGRKALDEQSNNQNNRGASKDGDKVKLV